MTSDEYKAALAAIGTTQSRFAEWTGVHPTSGRRWASAGVPLPVAKLLRLMAALRATPATVDKILARKAAT